MNDHLDRIELVAFDFDGVLTDNRVYVFEDGREAVVCNRADGLAFDMFRTAGMPTLILSTERNTVVAARAAKLRIPVVQGFHDKARALASYCQEGGIDLACVMFVGNDINDLAVMQMVGHPLAVADAHPAVKRAARTVLKARGGDGVAREIAETLLALLYEPETLDRSPAGGSEGP